MTWWARKVAAAAGKSREQAEGRWAATNASIVSAFAARTVSGHWAVDVRHGWRVLDSQRRAAYTLRSGNVRDAEGQYLCTVQRPARAALLLENGAGPLLVRHFPTAPLVAHVNAPSTALVTAALLPTGRLGQRSDIPYASQAWAELARARGPLAYSHVVAADGEVEGRLADTHDSTLVMDRRRYVRSSDGRSRSSLREWSLDLADNPLPDAWLLGILYATVLLAATPVTRRKSL